MGLNGPSEVKYHPWLRNFPWDDLRSGKLKSPFEPDLGDPFDVDNCNAEWKDADPEGLAKSQALLRRDSVQELFGDYYYDESYKGLT